MQTFKEKTEMYKNLLIKSNTHKWIYNANERNSGIAIPTIEKQKIRIMKWFAQGFTTS